jgi:hypothetical protein
MRRRPYPPTTRAVFRAYHALLARGHWRLSDPLWWWLVLVFRLYGVRLMRSRHVYRGA